MQIFQAVRFLKDSMLLLQGRFLMDFQIIKITDSGSGSVGFEWEFTFSSPISTYNKRWYREGIIIVNDLEIEKRLKATGLEERHGTRGPQWATS